VSAFAGLRFGLAHEVSILITLIGAVGRCPGVAPRSKISMMIMRLTDRFEKTTNFQLACRKIYSLYGSPGG
jgi:hypothetical protein